MSLSTIRSGRETGCIEDQSGCFTFDWNIKNFSLLPSQNGENIFSPDFYIVNSKGRCYLSLYPQGKYRNDADYVAIFLHIDPYRADQMFETTEFDAEISIILSSGITQKIEFTHQNRMREVLEYARFIERSELVKICAFDDKFTIRCKINIPCKTTNGKRAERAFDVQEGELSQDFCRLFKELPKLSDVTVVVGTQKFPAHKVVLATRSSVFSAMFEHGGTRENLKNEVRIEEMQPAVVEAMLEFFYTDKVANLKELAWGLLGACAEN